jgi:hypothetical protein
MSSWLVRLWNWIRVPSLSSQYFVRKASYFLGMGGVRAYPLTSQLPRDVGKAFTSSTAQRNFTSVPSSIDQAPSRLNRSEHLALLSIESLVSHPRLASPLGCSLWASDCLPELRLLQPPDDGALEVWGEARETR